MPSCVLNIVNINFYFSITQKMQKKLSSFNIADVDNGLIGKLPGTSEHYKKPTLQFIKAICKVNRPK